MANPGPGPLPENARVRAAPQPEPAPPDEAWLEMYVRVGLDPRTATVEELLAVLREEDIEYRSLMQAHAELQRSHTKLQKVHAALVDVTSRTYELLSEYRPPGYRRLAVRTVRRLEEIAAEKLVVWLPQAVDGFLERATAHHRAAELRHRGTVDELGRARDRRVAAEVLADKWAAQVKRSDARAKEAEEILARVRAAHATEALSLPAIDPVDPYPAAPEPFELLAHQEVIAKLYEHLQQLGPVRQSCVRRYFGLDGNAPETLAEIGLAYNLSRERIRQVISDSLRDIRRSINADLVPARQRRLAVRTLLRYHQVELKPGSATRVSLQEYRRCESLLAATRGSQLEKDRYTPRIPFDLYCDDTEKEYWL